MARMVTLSIPATITVDVIVENGRPDDWDGFVARMERDDPPVNDMT